MKTIIENDVLKESVSMMEIKLARKLFLGNKKAESKKAEIEKTAKELIIANNKLSFQYKEKVGLAAELILANKELAFQYEEKEKRAAELAIANIELAFQNKEKEKRAVELIIANRELDFQKLEKTIRESELLIANKKLIYKTQERQIKTAELNIANRDLKRAEDNEREYIEGLEKMMFLTSHKVRQPIANIIGFSNMLDQTTSSPEELNQLVSCIKEAAITLDNYTRELSSFIRELVQKEKKE
ncbi:diguanylate cyclase [Flavobacterium limnophilum]|uniref:diguanylate cyclase n=1 Tax=Flavobacterium limnophilum TaxID=3003262 RepID=UPI0024831E39|nr:diguanylate cyclase [Flavobacterium limnophilum]